MNAVYLWIAANFKSTLEKVLAKVHPASIGTAQKRQLQIGPKGSHMLSLQSTSRMSMYNEGGLYLFRRP